MRMQLYLLRHGPAQSRLEWKGPDSERPLTDRGIKVTRRVAARMAALGLQLDAVLTSPYVRALETARIVTDSLDSPDILISEPGLEPDRLSRGELQRIISDHPDAASLMLVGHEPSMSRVTADVIGGGRMHLRKSGLIRIDLPEPMTLQGELVWLAAPKLLSDS